MFNFKKLNNVLIVLSALVLLTGCGKANANATFIKRNADNVDSFNILTDLEEEKVIHTDRQAAYLSYDG